MNAPTPAVAGDARRPIQAHNGDGAGGKACWRNSLPSRKMCDLQWRREAVVSISSRAPATAFPRTSSASTDDWILRTALVAAAALLASCGGQKSDGAVQPGVYALSQSAGPPGTLVVKKDGSYVDMEDNVPKPVDRGSWRYEDGRFCLESAASAGKLCFVETVGKDGEIILADEGRTITLKPRK